MSNYDVLFMQAAQGSEIDWHEPFRIDMHDFLFAFQKSQSGLIKFNEDPVQSQPKSPVWAVSFHNDSGKNLALLRFLLHDIDHDSKTDLGIFIDDDSYFKEKHAVQFDVTEQVAMKTADRHLPGWQTMPHPLRSNHIIGFMASNVKCFSDARPQHLAHFLTGFAQELRAVGV